MPTSFTRSSAYEDMYRNYLDDLQRQQMRNMSMEAERQKVQSKRKADVDKAKKKVMDNMMKRSESEIVEEGISRTIMAIRERSMKYFKGTCVETFGRGVVLNMVDNHERGDTNYFYERRQREIENSKYMVLNNEVIASYKAEPMEVTFYPGMMNRSPEYQLIYEGLRGFFERYLPGVQLKEDKMSKFNNTSADARKDRETMLKVVEKARSQVTSYPYEFSNGYVSISPEFDSVTVTAQEYVNHLTNRVNLF